MAIWQTYRFGSARQMIDYLNGVIFGSVNLYNGADVDSLTFIVDVGAGDVTVTFEPVKNRNWTLDEIIECIEDTDASLVGIFSDFDMNKDRMQRNEMDFRLRALRDGSLTIAGEGTANEALGFAVTDTVRAAVVPTDIQDIQRPATEQDTWIVTINT